MEHAIQEKAKLCQDIGQSNKCLGSFNSVHVLICFFVNFNLTLRLPLGFYIKPPRIMENFMLYLDFWRVQTKGKVMIEKNFLKC